MTPKEKYNEEKDELKTSRMNRILSAAFDLFSVKGIDNVAMTDIAKKAEIGVASLYRYYETKDEIAIRTIIWAWNKQKENFLPWLKDSSFESLTGLEQVKKELSVFVNLFETQSAFLRFIYFFDSFAIRTNINQERLKDYEAMIGTIKSIMVDSIVKGIDDGSIKNTSKEEAENLYFILSHTMFSISQKLSLSGNMLSMDTELCSKNELEKVVDLLINGISK